MRKTNNRGFLLISIFALLVFVIAIAFTIVVSNRSGIFKSSDILYENPKVSDSKSSENYIYQNDEYGINIDPINIEDYDVELDEEVVSEQEKSRSVNYLVRILVKPNKPRKLDFAWASVEIGVSDSKNLDLEKTDEKGKLLFDEVTYETSSIIDKWGSKVYLFESHPWTLYIIDKGSNLFAVKIYLNNPDTKEEFAPIVEEVLNKIHID